MKDVEIGAVNNVKVYMKLDDLFRIANKEIQEYAEDLELENSKLQYKLETAIKTLRFYASKEHWNPDHTKEFSYMDGWEMAQDCLNEIEE